MIPSIRIVLRGVGLVLSVPGLMALATLPICYLFFETYALWAFGLTALVALGIGQFLYRFFRHSDETYLSHAMVIAALSWIAVSLVGALPFLLIGLQADVEAPTWNTMRAFRDPWNALFESFSGFTGTGLTVAADPAKLPRSLHWWRSLTEWVGGAGIIVLILTVLGANSGMYRLYFSEGRSERLTPSISSTVRTIWWIYLLFTVLGILLLRATGIPWWEAVNHGMTGIATGGFDVTGTSVARYDTGSRSAIILLMVLGATSFSMHYNLLVRRRITLLWHDAQTRLFWILLVTGIILLFLENRWFQGQFLWEDSIFQWVSALTTAGFSTVDIGQWSNTTQLLLSLAMFFGGMAGSTASGIKLLRVVHLYKGIMWRFQRISLRPHQVMRYELNDRAITEDEAERMVESAGVMVILWLILLAVGIFVMLHLVPEQYTLSQVVFEVSSAQSNVGLSVGITGPDLVWAGKLVLIMHMYMGRLEIIPVLILTAALLRRAGRLP